MSQVGNNDGGEFMVQDRDHMGDVSQSTDNAKRRGVRQAEQAQTGARQQGAGDENANRQPNRQPNSQQGAERKGEQRRQSY